MIDRPKKKNKFNISPNINPPKIFGKDLDLSQFRKSGDNKIFTYEESCDNKM